MGQHQPTEGSAPPAASGLGAPPPAGGHADRASGQAGRIGPGSRDQIFLAAVAVIGAAIALVNTLSVVQDHATDAQPWPFWRVLVDEGSSAMALVALSPALMTITRRARPFEDRWPRVTAAHAIGAIGFSLAHVAAMGVLRWLVFRAAGDSYSPFSPLENFLYEFRKDLVTYFALAATYAMWLRLTAAPTAQAAGDEAIEVRDGSRRLFVRVADIAWIEAAGNYVELHRDPAPVLHRAPLSEMERVLGPHGFVRIHRSRLVRRSAVAAVLSRPSGDYVVRLADGRELAGSRRYRRPLLEP